MPHRLPPHETLTVEFKSDRSKLPDRDLIEALVCLANAEGGTLWLGVEDDGTPTGLHAEHRLLEGLAGMVAARTSPSLSVQAEAVEVDGVTVARIRVPKAHGEVATTSGVYLRQAVQQYGGDRVLLELDDEALDGALTLTARQPDGSRVPTLTGLLLVGRETSLRQWVPTHEFAFQVLAQQAVRFNEFRRFPLLKALDWLETNFRPYNPEEELQVGLFRVPVPKVDMGAYREAVANALIHRDYHRLGAVHVRLEDEALVVSNPGGLVDGVTLANLLVTEPRPRNPTLADAMKRIGVVERSGRGVDKIFRGMLKFGRPAPDYSYTTAQSVVLRLPTTEADLDFRRLVVEHERATNDELPIDSLIALATLRATKRVSADELAGQIQRDTASAKRTLEALTEAGLVEAHGSTRARSYTLSASLYQAVGDKAAYTRQAGFSSIQNEQMVLNYVQQHGQVRRAEVMELCRLSEDQAWQLLKRLMLAEKLVKHGERRWSFYTLAGND